MMKPDAPNLDRPVDRAQRIQADPFNATGRIGLLAAVVMLVVAGGIVRPAVAQEDQVAEADDRRPARLLRLRLPVTGNADRSFTAIIDRTKERLLAEAVGESRPVIVIEFAPLGDGEGFGEGSDFARALSLARYLTSDEMAGVKTVAFVPRTIKGHAVLVAIACEEIAMSPAAEIGEAGIDEDPNKPVEPAVVEGYRQIARARRTVPEAIAIGMLDRRTEVVEVETEGNAVEYVDRDQVVEIEQQRTIVREETLFPPGTMGILTAREGRRVAAIDYEVDNRDSLARKLRIDERSLSEDGAMIADWEPVIYTVEGPISAQTTSFAKRLLDNEIAQEGVNWVGFRIDSTGGSNTYGQELAAYVSTLGGEELRTVAYIPKEASGVAALVALSCDQLVMHPEARLGGTTGDPIDPERLESISMPIRESLAADSPHTWSLLMALFDPDIEVYRYTNRKTGTERFYCPEEVGELPDRGDWKQGELITEPGEVLQLTGDDALALGIATHVVNNLEELVQVYGFEQSPREVKTTWSLELAEALASPGVTVLLLVIAFAGIYFELHTPGLGIGGFVAALALLLFFWSKALDATVGWLEVLLLLGGIVSILLEIFVVPGVGIFGLGGALMVISALVLAGQRSLVPQTAEDFEELQTSLAVVATAGVLSVIAAIALRRYLPQIPILNQIMLHGPQGEELAELNYRESLAEFSHLVGRQGVTTTPLVPSGRADIDGELVDVIASGEMIEKGVTVEVVSARGSRVEVRAVAQNG